MKDLAPCPDEIWAQFLPYESGEICVDAYDHEFEGGIKYTRASTPTPDLGVAVAALKWSKKRIEYLQLMLGDRHDCKIRYIDEALKSLGGE